MEFSNLQFRYQDVSFLKINDFQIMILPSSTIKSRSFRLQTLSIFNYQKGSHFDASLAISYWLRTPSGHQHDDENLLNKNFIILKSRLVLVNRILKRSITTRVNITCMIKFYTIYIFWYFLYMHIMN